MTKRIQSDISAALSKLQSAVAAQGITMGRHSHTIKSDPEVLSRLDAMQTTLNLILKNLGVDMATQADIAAALAKVQTDVTAQTTVDASLATYVAGINAQLAAIAANTTDTTTAAALTALSTQIEANTASDAAAMVANTPVAPPAAGP